MKLKLYKIQNAFGIWVKKHCKKKGLPGIEHTTGESMAFNAGYRACRNDMIEEKLVNAKPLNLKEIKDVKKKVSVDPETVFLQ